MFHIVGIILDNCHAFIINEPCILNRPKQFGYNIVQLNTSVMASPAELH